MPKRLEEDMNNRDFYHYISRVSNSIVINRGHAIRNISNLNLLDKKLEGMLHKETDFEFLLQQANYIAARQLINNYQFNQYINKWSAKVNRAFSSKDLPAELASLGFNELVDVMWAQNSPYFSCVEKLQRALEQPGSKSITACAKLIDKLASKSEYIIKYDHLLDQMARKVFTKMPLGEMPVDIKARLLKHYCTLNAHTQQTRTHGLILALASDLKQHLEEIDETVVFDLLEAANISQNIPNFNGRTRDTLNALNFEVNNFVSKMVDIASEDVEVQFLVDYLSMIAELKQNNLRVPKEILDPVIALAETKAAAALQGDYNRRSLPPTNFQLKVAARFNHPNLIELAKRSFESDNMALTYEILIDRLNICKN